ncbi:hypothetical protein RRG08_034369 [Elysia crispata]|uniref:Uncharacterized protein n=1 Tax=Elysia crispata TaxID=231223 RepID=A0AAE0YCT8_9GAST|nr:hypothetical protein RRG08_034369 [Elysia crispata]
MESSPLHLLFLLGYCLALIEGETSKKNYWIVIDSHTDKEEEESRHDVNKEIACNYVRPAGTPLRPVTSVDRTTAKATILNVQNIRGLVLIFQFGSH